MMKKVFPYFDFVIPRSWLADGGLVDPVPVGVSLVDTGVSTGPLQALWNPTNIPDDGGKAPQYGGWSVVGRRNLKIREACCTFPRLLC